MHRENFFRKVLLLLDGEKTFRKRARGKLARSIVETIKFVFVMKNVPCSKERIKCVERFKKLGSKSQEGGGVSCLLDDGEKFVNRDIICGVLQRLETRETKFYNAKTNDAWNVKIIFTFLKSFLINCRRSAFFFLLLLINII